MHSNPIRRVFIEYFEAGVLSRVFIHHHQSVMSMSPPPHRDGSIEYPYEGDEQKSYATLQLCSSCMAVSQPKALPLAKILFFQR